MVVQMKMNSKILMMRVYAMNKIVLLLACSLFASDWSKQLDASGVTRESQSTLSKVSGVGGQLCLSIVATGKSCIPKETYDLISSFEKTSFQACLVKKNIATSAVLIVPSDSIAVLACEPMLLDIQRLSPTDQFLNVGRFVCGLRNGQDSLYVSACRSAED